MTTQATEAATKTATAKEPGPSPRHKTGRPKGDPAKLRNGRIGVRVTADEFAVLRAKAEEMRMTPAQWLRDAALKRRLPPPPVAAINREQYVELARLSANLNQLAHHANTGKSVVVAEALLQKLTWEVAGLRLALLGVESRP